MIVSRLFLSASPPLCGCHRDNGGKEVYGGQNSGLLRSGSIAMDEDGAPLGASECG